MLGEAKIALVYTMRCPTTESAFGLSARSVLVPMTKFTPLLVVGVLPIRNLCLGRAPLTCLRFLGWPVRDSKGGRCRIRDDGVLLKLALGGNG